SAEVTSLGRMSLDLSSGTDESIYSPGEKASHHELVNQNVSAIQFLRLLKLNTRRLAWRVVVIAMRDGSPLGIIESGAASHQEQKKAHEQTDKGSENSRVAWCGLTCRGVA